MWAACRRSARLLQRSYWAASTLVPPAWLPGRREAWSTVANFPFVREHEQEWRRWFGAVELMALYNPSQVERSGFAVLLKSGDDRWFVKLRPEWDPELEISIAERTSTAETFWAPEVVGYFEASGWTSLGWTTIPPGIHSPVVRGEIEEVVTEISQLLNPVLGGADGWAPSHGDMGPWNLRQPKDGRPALFDWELAGLAPISADAVFHAAASASLGLPTKVDVDRWPAARDYWLDEIPRRFGSAQRDARIARQMVRFLKGYSEPNG